MSEFIKTKLLFEYKPGQLIGLGFGNIINSDADLLIVSAFESTKFVSLSSIGALSAYLKETANIDLEELVNDELTTGYQLIDLSPHKLRFRKLLIISMGGKQSLNIGDRDFVTDQIMNNLKRGLAKARILLSKEQSAFTVDITAMGTTYGGLRRKECFDMLINWAADFFNSTPHINLLRFIAFDLDTFVDFFESAFRLQKVRTENELVFAANFDTESLSQFKSEISVALQSLDINPRSVIITCRSIIETIVKSRIPDPTIKLADGIFSLKDKVPPSIYSYLTTCRLLGNFSNHDPNFTPTRRDGEAILLLTLRVVEWHLSNLPLIGSQVPT